MAAGSRDEDDDGARVKKEALLSPTFFLLLFLQVASRLFPFGLNVLVTQQLTYEQIGLQAIQFHLFTTTALCLSRQGFRLGCQRKIVRGSESNDRVLRVACLTWPWGLIVSFGVYGVIMLWQGLTDYAFSMKVLGVAAVLELGSEPLYILAQHLQLVKLRVWIEGAATVTRCVVTYTLVYQGIGLGGGLVFAYAQLAEKLDRELVNLCATFTFESMQKLLLQEGEKLALVLFGTAYNQGVYGLVDNLVRKKDDVERILILALKLVFLVGLMFVAFGPNFASLLLHKFYKQEWSDGDAPKALGFYCFYVLALALNGVSEAFGNAVATKEELFQSSFWRFVFSIFYMGLSVKLVQVAPSTGLILGNTIIMGIRITRSLTFIRKFFRHSKTFSLQQAIPNMRALVALGISSMITFMSKTWLLDDKRHTGLHAWLWWCVPCTGTRSCFFGSLVF